MTHRQLHRRIPPQHGDSPQKLKTWSRYRTACRPLAGWGVPPRHPGGLEGVSAVLAIFISRGGRDLVLSGQLQGLAEASSV